MRNWTGFVHEGTNVRINKIGGCGGHQSPEFVDEKKERMKREDEKRLKSTQYTETNSCKRKKFHIIVGVRG
jgi:hypothetical protein